MDPGLRLSADMAPMSPADIRAMQDIPYGQAVGSLVYLAVATRPDIARTVGNLARFSQHPGMAHWKAVKHLFRYIKGTLDYKFTYSPSSETELFTSYTDADHAGCPDTGRSISGYMIKMGTGAISWSSRLQTIVAYLPHKQSTLQRSLLPRRCSGCEICSQSLASTFQLPLGCTLTICLRSLLRRILRTMGSISISHLHTDSMPADILIRSLPHPKVLDMVKMLGLET